MSKTMKKMLLYYVAMIVACGVLVLLSILFFDGPEITVCSFFPVAYIALALLVALYCYTLAPYVDQLGEKQKGIRFRKTRYSDSITDEGLEILPDRPIIDTSDIHRAEGKACLIFAPLELPFIFFFPDVVKGFSILIVGAAELLVIGIIGARRAVKAAKEEKIRLAREQREQANREAYGSWKKD